METVLSNYKNLSTICGSSNTAVALFVGYEGYKYYGVDDRRLKSCKIIDANQNVSCNPYMGKQLMNEIRHVNNCRHVTM